MTTTLKDTFDARTRSGHGWGYSVDVGGIVTGFIIEGDRHIDLSWIRDHAGNLFSQHGRAYDIQQRVLPATPPEVTNPARALNGEFIVSNTRRAQVFYTIELTAALSLLGTHTDDVAVALLIDGIIEESTVKNLLTATIVLGLALTLTHQKVLTGYVPAGSTVQLVSSGSGVATLVQSLEVLL